MTPAMKRYTRWFLFWMLVYGILVIAAQLILDHLPESTALRVAVALSPVLPALMALREFVIAIRSADEVQARIHSEALLISMGVIGMASFAWGFAEGAVQLPEISLLWVLPAMVFVWSIAQIFVTRRYQ